MNKEQALRSIQFFYRIINNKYPLLFPHMFVAGGAVRDTIFNKEIKDIDIFIPIRFNFSSEANNQFIHFIKTCCTPVCDREYDSDFVVYSLTDTFAKIKLVLDNIQIIVRYDHNNIEDVVKNFPVSISRVYFDHMNNKVVKSKAFIKSQETRTVYYKIATKQDMKYINRIRDKYYELLWKRVGSLS